MTSDAHAVVTLPLRSPKPQQWRLHLTNAASPSLHAKVLMHSVHDGQGIGPIVTTNVKLGRPIAEPEIVKHLYHTSFENLTIDGYISF